MFELLQSLCMIPGAPGCEEKVADFIAEAIAPWADEVLRDGLGSVIGVVRGNGEHKKRLLFSAHMDEVGGMVSGVDDKGRVWFTRNGYPRWDAHVFHQVHFENGGLGMLAAPVNCKEYNDVNCYIDVGAETREEALRVVEIGESFTFLPGVKKLFGNRVAGHPIDDRIGCVIEMEAMRRMKEEGITPYHDCYFGFAVQEETMIPAVGASSLTQFVKPEIGIAVDVCTATDVPGGDVSEVALGKGAVITVRDCTIVCDKRLVKDMKAAANENGIPYMLEVSHVGGNDAVPMQAFGARSGLISIPMRYLHTVAETMDLEDAENCVKLTVAVCRKEM